MSSYGKLLPGKGENNRFQDSLKFPGGRDYSHEMTRKMGEYIDQFTHVPDLRTTEQIMNRKPKCCE